MEYRKDYILERWVICATERKARPKQFHNVELTQEGVCYFCPGNENLTPPEIGRLLKNGDWEIRWFPNKYPFLSVDAGCNKDDKQLVCAPAYGKHEVIAECSEHDKQLWDLDKEHITKILNVYKDRIAELIKLRGIKYVQIFKNHGKDAGTSLIHSHSQVAALDRVPPSVIEEQKASTKTKKCAYCSIIKKEAKSKRLCFENKTMVAFAPYASRFNYEVWIFPKRHVDNMLKLKENEISDLAEIMQKILVKLREINAPYNHYLHYGNGLHFHIEVTPKLATWAGFEYATDIIINSVMPESAAEFYRGK